MPSPVGHALGGLAAGCLVAGRPRVRFLVGFAVVATLPDLDLLLPIQHRGPTHSIGAGLGAFAVALLIQRACGRAGTRVRLAAAFCSAYLSHVFLDWLGADRWPPQGVMAIWPLTREFHLSGFDVFSRIERRYWLAGFWWGNALAILREIIIIAPVAWLVWKIRAGGDRSIGQSGSTESGETAVPRPDH